MKESFPPSLQFMVPTGDSWIVDISLAPAVASILQASRGIGQSHEQVQQMQTPALGSASHSQRVTGTEDPFLQDTRSPVGTFLPLQPAG